MIISAHTVLELNKKHNIIEDLCERESNPEGTGFDVRIGSAYILKGDGFLGKENRKTPPVQMIGSHQRGGSITLNPGDYVTVKTIETVHIPPEKVEIDGKMCHIMMDVKPRSTLFRSGIQLMCTRTDPGYSGQLVFGLANIGPVHFNLELGSRIANVIFHTVYGELARPYEGQWKGGRMTTEGVEKQN